MARFRYGFAGRDRRVVERQGARTVGGSSVDGVSWPVFDRAVIAAACECPRLVVELLVEMPDEADD
jgi:hypothetical protein